MKKIMFMLGAIAAAGVASAASLDWSISKKSFKWSDDSTSFTGATVYVLNAGIGEFDTLKTVLATGTGGAADYENLAAVLGGTEYRAALIATGTTLSSKPISSNYSAASGTATVDSVGNYTLAILVTDGEKYLLSGTVTGLSYADSPDDGAAAAFGSSHFADGWKTYTYTSGGDTPTPGGDTDTPEPTSGVLMLVGAAMVALKRKQR